MTAPDAGRRQRDADRTVARHHARTECAKVQAERDSYLLTIAAMHSKRTRTVDGYTLRWCRECQQDWPCPTIEATRGPRSLRGARS